MKIIFLGAPGAGKGTQAAAVSRELGIPTISTGNLIREAIANGTPVGLMAKDIIAKGQLLSDDVVVGIVREKLKTVQSGYILDGFPRTVAQAEALEKMGEDVDTVINIYVPDEVIVKRSAGRRFCPKCGATYHVQYNPPRNDNGTLLCAECGSKVAVRDDDKEDVVRHRLEVYHEQTQPLEVFYEKRGKLRTVIGQEEVADTTALTLKAVKGN
ncbi:MAG: adenylate kinase [Clostridia bacterium]|nr:adenylate kinase [Clostridia bacterium]